MPRLDVTDEAQLGKLMVQVWKDPAARMELLRNPEATLKANGVKIDLATQRVIVHEDTPSTVHLIIPVEPDSDYDVGAYEDLLGRVIVAGCR